MIYDKQARMKKPRDEQAQRRTDVGMNTVWMKRWCESLRK